VTQKYIRPRELKNNDQQDPRNRKTITTRRVAQIDRTSRSSGRSVGASYLAIFRRDATLPFHLSFSIRFAFGA
jgi:hypothetical protein